MNQESQQDSRSGCTRSKWLAVVEAPMRYFDGRKALGYISLSVAVSRSLSTLRRSVFVLHERPARCNLTQSLGCHES
jgi:hypothetical protein